VSAEAADLGRRVASVEDAERRGELLAAVDLAEQGLAEHPGATALQYRAVLALARAGSTEQAARRFEEYRLRDLDTEDVLALEARIAKDVALAAAGDERRLLALRSAALYAQAFAATGGYYPAINAATLMLVGGNVEASRTLARTALQRLSESGEDGYFAAATEAEGRLLLGEVDAARVALERAAELHGNDYGAVATTRRQLRLVCDRTGIDPDVLSALAGPRVLHYCGHRIASDGSGPFRPEDEAAVAAAIRAELDHHPAAYAYGSLANGADIITAEALLERGSELHVVLPFAEDEFVAVSVADPGGDWVERYRRCRAAATQVTFATDDSFLEDDVLYRYASELAMGLALLRARFVDGDALQVAIWDGRPARGGAGTAIDIATWNAGDRKTAIVAPPRHAAADGAAPVAPERRGRVIRAMLFGDVRGFSKLGDAQLPVFNEHILGAFATVLERHAPQVSFRNTWGDGLYVVMTDALAAAACALDLQAAMGQLDLARLALPDHLALRLGAHVGPVFELRDPVLGLPSFGGSQVSRTARIEPVTPPGTVYVTEPFAAALELAGTPFACDYVGHMPAAKDFGRLRMYRLRAASPPRRHVDEDTSAL
jgi:tetratricopeptide (TPR) repeat protein